MGSIKKFFSFLTFTCSLLIAAAIAFFILVVCLRNHVLLDLDLLVIKFTQVPVELVVLSSFGVGVAFGLLVAFLLFFRRVCKLRAAH